MIRSKPQVEVDDELAFHLEERTREYEARGLDPAAARAAALERLGDLEGVRRECAQLLGAERRSEERRERLSVSWLDFKLGFRMLVKYPGLTLIGGLAIAFAIWVGAGTFAFVSQVLYPTLPLEDGHRIVGIHNHNVATNRASRQVLHDFATWREELRTVDDVGAFRSRERNLITGEGRGEPAEVMEISASAFRVARVPPLLGRTLVEEDERPDAPPVVVLGYDLWRERFRGDPEVVGRQVRLGSAVHTVVGVMPENFAFPINQSLWAPLRLNPLEHERGEGPGLRVFGRLAPGATLEEAQAELSTLGRRAAADFPQTHQHLRPRVLPHARSILNIPAIGVAGLVGSNLLVVLLVVLVCGNVALLMFARAAARESEMVVRSALGASRGRIITQLFAEALVLAGIGAAIGLALASSGLRWGMRVVELEVLEGSPLPFWVDVGLTPTMVLYAAALTVLAALIAGVVPALKVTRGLGARLRQASAGGGGGFRFGGIWTVVIVAQVAVTMVFPVIAFGVRRDAVQIRSLDVGFPEQNYLSVRLQMDPGDADGAAAETSREAMLARFGATVQELERRVEAEPGVLGATVAERLPRMYHPHRQVELDQGGAAPISPELGHRRVSSASVALDYFDVLDAPVLQGRGFHSGDLAPEARTVIVNQSFVERILGGHNPIGRHVRYLHFEEWDDPQPADDQPWYQIVGVVRDLGMAVDRDPKAAGIYHPAPPGATAPVHMAVHVRGDPEQFAPRLRALGAAVDPTLKLHDVVRLDRMDQAELEFGRFWFGLTTLVSGVALLLSLTGIYSVLSFTVSQRTREIGIRVALGGSAPGIIAAIFRRPLAQVGFGILAGGGVLALLMSPSVGGALTARGVALLVAYAALMMLVCMLACIVPARRALRVQPTEALRAEG